MWASPFLFFLFYPKDFPCARACSQIISYAILKESKLCVFPVFWLFKGGSSYGIHYHLRLIRAGKSSAAAFLEDLGFYCVDNMPVALITNFAGLCMAGAGHRQIRPGGPGHRHPAGARPLTSSFRPWTACRRCTWTISFSSSRPPTRTLSAGTRRPATPTPSPARATPCRRR